MNLIYDLGHYTKIFVRYLGKRTYWIFGLTLAAGLAESFGLVMLIPLIQLFFSDEVPINSSAKLAIDMMDGILLFFGWDDRSSGIFLVVAIAFILKGLLLFSALAYAAILRAQLLYDLKTKLYESYGKMSFDYYSSKDTGYFINVINEQITRALQAFKSFCRLGVQIVTALVYLGAAFFLSWKLAIFASFLGFLVLILFKKLSITVKDMSRKVASESGHLSDLLIQMLQGFKYLLATNQIQATEEKVFGSAERLADYHKKTGIAHALTQAAQEPISLILMIGIIFFQLYILGESIVPIMVAMLLFYRGVNAIIGIQALWQGTLEFIGSMEIVDNEFQNQFKHKEIFSEKQIENFSSIVASNVNFTYGTNDSSSRNLVISDVNFEIPVNSITAFVGKSGAGKSTIIDLLAVIHKPVQGRVLFDSIPSTEVSASSWRNRIGYVSQDTVMFNDTIENNIGFGVPQALRDDDFEISVRAAAQLAHIHDVIEAFPKKYQTEIGDRGMRLSGGQRQRLFIARELFRKPKLLLLDEATSALDSESEKLIQKSIDSLRGSVTVVIVSHRFSTIRSADKIYVMNNGKVVEEGSFRDLQNKNGVFARMAESQRLHD